MMRNFAAEVDRLADMAPTMDPNRVREWCNRLIAELRSGSRRNQFIELRRKLRGIRLEQTKRPGYERVWRRNR